MSDWSKEMMEALEADGEKLRQLTGEDHGPWFFPDEPPLMVETCAHCGGDGYIIRSIWVHEPGCGYGHDSTEEVRCEACDGKGSTELVAAEELSMYERDEEAKP